MEEIKKMVENQRLFFSGGNTKDILYRKHQLNLLKNAIHSNEQEIMDGLKMDLNKSAFESYETEIGIVLEEIKFMLRNMERLTKSRRVKTPITHFLSGSRIYKEPYGVVLIIAPWNYPFQLALVPLVGAIATGNCSIIKPSNYSPNTSAIIKKIINACFSPEYIGVIEGGRDTNQTLLDEKFDYIFFTGSVSVGKLVMEKAATHLTPVVLELGGKSPCIIDQTADIRIAARRLAWGKFLNAGQTCVAPDYLLIHESVKEQFIKEFRKNIMEMYGDKPESNEEFPKIINEKHFARLISLIASGEVIIGGNTNSETNQIAPTVLNHVSWEDKIMEEEIFGPILPILEYHDLSEIAEKINGRPKPLALYLFTTSKENELFIVNNISYGGGCINDTIIHLATSYLAFGGVGNSGMGNYHGEASINTLSHHKSVLKKSNLLDIPLRYPPYKKHLDLLKKILK